MEPIESNEKLQSGLLNYIGPSMNPTLKPGDRLFISPYDGQKISRGDVVVFIPPGGDSKITHRVVSIHSRGIKTRGDNNKELDQWVLDPDQIFGRVVYAQRGSRRRRVFGGLLGVFFAATVRVIHEIDSRVSFLLRPAYQELARVDIFSRLMSTQMKPRVISFNRAGGTELQLLMGRRVIGRWRPGHKRWHIRRPFRMFVDEETLPENKAKGSSVEFQVSGVHKDK